MAEVLAPLFQFTLKATYTCSMKLGLWMPRQFPNMLESILSKGRITEYSLNAPLTPLKCTNLSRKAWQSSCTHHHLLPLPMVPYKLAFRTHICIVRNGKNIFHEGGSYGAGILAVSVLRRIDAIMMTSTDWI